MAGVGLERSALLQTALAGVFVLLSGLGCTTARTENGAAQQPLLVGAAANLKVAFGEIGTAFTAKTGQKVVFSFGSTGSLAKQIENGAPVDVFAAADTGFVDDLARKDIVASDTVAVYTIGRLVLTSSKEAGVIVGRPEDLLRPEVKRVAIANPEHAPYGRAAKDVLVNLGIWQAVQPKLVYGENVEQTLQLIRTGNAEAGMVPLSIAGVPEVDYILVEPGLYAPLRQSIAVVKRTKNDAMARAFVAFVESSEGQAILKKHGYASPGDS